MPGRHRGDGAGQASASEAASYAQRLPSQSQHLRGSGAAARMEASETKSPWRRGLRHLPLDLNP